MKIQIEIKDWKYINHIAKHKENSQSLIEKFIDGHFEYYDQNDIYIGRYNSDTSLFKDGLILAVLDSEY